MLGYINPQLAAVLAAQAGKLPVMPQPVSTAAPDPLAPLPDTPAPAPLQADSPNDGINSVGRPSDQPDPALEAAKLAGHEKALKKLQRQGKGEALLALGASLLSARTFGEGMSNGLANYVKALSASRERYKPKHETIGDGTFDKITDPVDDSVSYERTPYADEKQKQLQIVTGGKLDVANIQAGAKVETANIGADSREKVAKFGWDSRKDIVGLQTRSNERIAQWHNTTAEAVAHIRAANGGRANSGIEKQVTELGGDVVNISNSLSRGAPVLESIRNGSLKFGVVDNAKHKAQLAGLFPRDDSTTSYSQYQTFKEQLRGAWLMAFKGVQTEGDAQRAMDAILSGEGDTASVKQNLETVIGAIERQLNQKQTRLDELSHVSRSTSSTAPAATPEIKWRRVQ